MAGGDLLSLRPYNMSGDEYIYSAPEDEEGFTETNALCLSEGETTLTATESTHAYAGSQVASSVSYDFHRSPGTAITRGDSSTPSGGIRGFRINTSPSPKRAFIPFTDKGKALCGKKTEPPLDFNSF